MFLDWFVDCQSAGKSLMVGVKAYLVASGVPVLQGLKLFSLKFCLFCMVPKVDSHLIPNVALDKRELLAVWCRISFRVKVV